MICVVSYKLVPKRAIPPNFLNELKKQGNGWAHHIDDVWLISTFETLDQVKNRLERHLNLKESGGDLLWLAEVTSHAGWMPKSLWDWYNKERAKGY